MPGRCDEVTAFDRPIVPRRKPYMAKSNDVLGAVPEFVFARGRKGGFSSEKKIEILSCRGLTQKLYLNTIIYICVYIC